jgi:hypothetical protein
MTHQAWALEQERRHLSRKVLYFQQAFNAAVVDLVTSHGPLHAHIAEVRIPEISEQLEAYENALLAVELDLADLEALV